MQFDEKLDDLINEYLADIVDRDDAIDDVISALELELMALKEEKSAED